jgi:hypothetical protein
VIRGAAALERAGAKVCSYTISLSSSYLPSTKLPLFLYTLVLASLNTPGGAPGNPWSGRRPAPVLSFVPLSLSLSCWWSEVERALLRFCQVSCHVARRVWAC